MRYLFKLTTKFSTLLFYSAVIFTLILSNGKDLLGQQIESKNGVRYIKNSGSGTWNNSPEISIKLEGTLGGQDLEDENYLFFYPTAIAGGKDGNVYVVDDGNFRVQVFDKNHKYLKTIGRRGQGPSEFLRPKYIEVSNSDQISVYDFGNRRISFFESNGEFIKTKRVDEYNYEFKFRSDGNVIVRNPKLGNGRYKNKNDIPLFRMFDKDWNLIKTIGKAKYFNKTFLNTDPAWDGKSYDEGGNRLFFTVDGKDNIYLSYMYINRIEKYDAEGNLIFRSSRELNNDMLIDKSEDFYFQISNGMDVDSEGRIWVITPNRKIKKDEKTWLGMSIVGGISTYIPQGNPEQVETDIFNIEVYSKDGVLLHRFPITHFCDDLKIINDKIYILEKIREMKFYIYTIANGQ